MRIVLMDKDCSEVVKIITEWFDDIEILVITYIFSVKLSFALLDIKENIIQNIKNEIFFLR